MDARSAHSVDAVASYATSVGAAPAGVASGFVFASGSVSGVIISSTAMLYCHGRRTVIATLQ